MAPGATGGMTELSKEAQRIRSEYDRRDRELPSDRYSLTRPDVLYTYQQRVRATLAALRRHNLLPLSKLDILDIGCGTGDWLADFARWGADPDRLAGIELDERRASIARQRACGAIRVGDAAALPWPSASFDLVVQGTVFTSILDDGMRHAVAAEMRRVLRPRGAVLWYDFFYDNPWNRGVRRVTRADLQRLFPGFSLHLRRVTLAPPIARRVAAVAWLPAALLEAGRALNTHYLGVLWPP